MQKIVLDSNVFFSALYSNQGASFQIVSMNQFIATAIAEKMSALATFDYLSKRASKANRNDFEAIMAKVPNKKPLKGDEI